MATPGESVVLRILSQKDIPEELVLLAKDIQTIQTVTTSVSGPKLSSEAKGSIYRDLQVIFGILGRFDEDSKNFKIREQWNSVWIKFQYQMSDDLQTIRKRLRKAYETITLENIPCKLRFISDDNWWDSRKLGQIQDVETITNYMINTEGYDNRIVNLIIPFLQSLTSDLQSSLPPINTEPPKVTRDQFLLLEKHYGPFLDIYMSCQYCLNQNFPLTIGGIISTPVRQVFNNEAVTTSQLVKGWEYLDTKLEKYTDLATDPYLTYCQEYIIDHMRGKLARSQEKAKEASEDFAKKKNDFNTNTPGIYMGTVRGTLIEARNLPAVDRGGTSDPYGLITFGNFNKDSVVNQPVRTNVLDKNLNPSWNREFSFAILKDISQVPALTIQIWDHNTIQKDELLGEHVFNILDYKHPVEGWYNLQNLPKQLTVPLKGSAELHLKLHYASEIFELESAVTQLEKDVESLSGVLKVAEPKFQQRSLSKEEHEKRIQQLKLKEEQERKEREERERLKELELQKQREQEELLAMQKKAAMTEQAQQLTNSNENSAPTSNNQKLPPNRQYESVLYRLPFNLGQYKGTHNSCMVDCNINMPSIVNQLNSGISVLEFDIHWEGWSTVKDWRLGSLKPEQAVNRKATENPESCSLRYWFSAVKEWSAENPNHLPLVLMIDIKKDDMADAPGYSSGNVLRLNQYISDTFGSQLFTLQDLQNLNFKWPTIGELLGRVIVVLTGSLAVKQQYLCWKGQQPSVAMNKHGLIVEVHNKEEQIFYWSGRYKIDGTVEWLHTGCVAMGKRPSVAINDDGFLMIVYESPTSEFMIYSVGKFLATGEVVWREPKEYDTGVTPAIALQADGKRFVEVHKSQKNEILWYHVGKFDVVATNSSTTSFTDMIHIEWGPSKKFPNKDTGKNPSIRFSNRNPNQIEEIHQSPSNEKPWFWEATLDDMKLEWDTKTHAQTEEMPFRNQCAVLSSTSSSIHCISIESRPEGLYWETEKKKGYIRPKQLCFVELNYPGDYQLATAAVGEHNKDVWFVSTKADADLTVVNKFKSAGKIIRLYNYNEKNWVVPKDPRTAPTIAATDFPEKEAFHQAYKDTVTNYAKL